MRRGSVAAQLKQLNDAALAKADKVRQQITAEVFGLTIMASPIDEGRFAGNWRLGVDQIPTGYDNSISGNAVQIRQRNSDEITAGAAKTKPDGTVYLVNNLPYAARLEYTGWSMQAPNGMIGPTLALFPQIVTAVMNANRI